MPSLRQRMLVSAGSEATYQTQLEVFGGAHRGRETVNHHYSDIRDLTDQPVNWWDEHAVPRYCEFSPKEVANIYAVECALVEIACQDCNTGFHVAFSWSRTEHGYRRDGQFWTKMSEPMTVERVRLLHYGDPPNITCCAAGPTMNSEPRKVLEFWRQPDSKWERVPELQVWIGEDVRVAHTEGKKP